MKRNTIERVIVVGGGLAAAKAAEALRTEGFDGSVQIVTEEPHEPYERPPLSKDVLLGKQGTGETVVHERPWFDEHDIELVVADAVSSIDRQAHTVTTSSGRQHGYDRLILATGAQPRRLPVPGADLDGVHYLRTWDDAERLSDLAGRVGHATVVGAGWIGSEVTAALRQRGVDVTLVDPEIVPLGRVMGDHIGRVFRDLHTENGVDLRLGRAASRVEGEGQVQAIVLDDGERIHTDLVVIGIGVSPRTELAQSSGLAVDDGILVDETLVSSDPAILAAGDVARARHPLYSASIRVEHWANALNQGTTAGRNALDLGEVYDRLPYFFTDQYDLGMEYSGYAPSWDDVVVRGDLESREFVAFWLERGRVVAAMNCNVWDVTEPLQRLIRSGATPPRQKLTDSDVPLAELAPLGEG